MAIGGLGLSALGSSLANVPEDMAGLQLAQAKASLGQSQAAEESNKVQGGLAMNKALAQNLSGQQMGNDPFANMDSQIQAQTQTAQQLAQQGYGQQAQAAQKQAMELSAQKRQLALSHAAQASRAGNYDALAKLAPHMGIEGVTRAEYDPEEGVVNLKDAEGNIVGGMPKQTMDELDLTPEQRAIADWKRFNTERQAGSRENVAQTNKEKAVEQENIRQYWRNQDTDLTGRYSLQRQEIANKKPTAASAGNGPVEESNVPAGASGDAALQGIPESRRATVAAIVEGRLKMPTGFVMKSPWGQAVVSDVNKVDPNWSEQRAQIRRDFTTGPDGRNRAALNTASVHLDAYMQAMAALQNGTLQPGNALYNKLTTMLGQAPPTTAQAIRNAVAGEQASALKGNATDKEIEHVLTAMQDSASPDQFINSGKAALGVMHQKLQTYQDRFNEQLPDDKIWTAVLPSAKQIFDKYGIGGMNRPATQPKSGTAQPMSLDDYLKKHGA